MASVSLFSGAVLGPEGGIGGIASKIAAFYGERAAIPIEHRSRLVFAALASAYNSLVANPLFTGILAADPARDGPWLLLVMAVAKLALLAVAFKSGFLGGPTFPAIFASVSVALAVTLLLPSVTESVVIGGVMARFLMVPFRAPFMVILLTSVLLQAGPQLLAMVVPGRGDRHDRAAVRPGRDRRAFDVPAERRLALMHRAAGAGG
jgi:hypothetical protein